MRYQQLIFAPVAAGALCLSAPSPAFAETSWHLEETKSAALQWEIGYLALSAIDAGQTIHCLHRGACVEGNPLLGKHPSDKEIILSKIGLGIVHFTAFSLINNRNPKTALRAAQVSCVVQGSVVMINARITFK